MGTLKSLLLAILASCLMFTATSCGRVVDHPGPQGVAGGVGPQGVSASPCTVSNNASGAVITCPGSDPVFVSNGSQGIQGLVGATGPQGPTGAAGSSCSASTIAVGGATPNGGALISCTDGTQAVVLNGTNGSDGSSGTVVTAVELCPKQGAASYGSWPEVAFCISNVLYALFEDGKGNLSNSPLSDGSYNDASNNQTCSFTVSNGCTVTEN